MQHGCTQKFHRWVALVLAIMMILSALPVHALSDEVEPPVYCGQPDHIHTEQCYVAPDPTPIDETPEVPTEAPTEPALEALSNEVPAIQPDTYWTGTVSGGPYSGVIQLSDNVILESEITVSGDSLTIDLNGFVLQVNPGNHFATVETGKTLTIVDSNLSSVHYGTISQEGLWVYDEAATSGTAISGGIVTIGAGTQRYGGDRGGAIEVYGILNLQGGTLAGWKTQPGNVDTSGDIQYTNGSGGAVFVRKGAQFTMSGGAIAYCRPSTRFSEANGGAVLVHGEGEEKGTFQMTDGRIYGCNATNGGAVFTYGTGQFTMDGGTIFDNHASNNGGGVFARGCFTMNGGTICNNTSGGYGAGVYVEKYDTITNFTMTGGAITENHSTNWGAGVFAAGHFVMTGGTISKNRTTQSGAGLFVNTDGSFTMHNGLISGNQSNANGGGIYTRGTLVIHNGEISGNTAQNGGGIYSSGVSEMKKGTISNNTVTANGGGIYTDNEFTMIDGTIHGNRTHFTGEYENDLPVYTGEGGGVYVNSANGKFTMDNGTISGNTASSGGGVMIWTDGAFTMNGGTISGNFAYGNGGYGNGGAVYAFSNAEFLFYAGTLENNTARRYGGGVNINLGATLSLLGDDACYIRGNTADNGGGLSQELGECKIALHKTNIFITGNTATTNGGGLFVEMGTLEISAGTISGNSAGIAGGGISLHVENNKDNASVLGHITLNMSGGTVHGNTAVVSGGGIDIYADKNNYPGLNEVVVNLTGGTFDGNATTNGSGGAIDVWVNKDNSTAQINIGTPGTPGPSLVNNTANTNGGAIHIGNGSIEIFTGTISSNTANGSGGGLAVNNGEVIMSGGTISNNRAVTGDGGGLFVSSSDANTVSVKVFSGILSGNSASGNGGAVGVQGHEDSTIQVQIGVNLAHFDQQGNPIAFQHDENGKQTATPPDSDPYLHTSCPVIAQNTAGQKGGAFHIAGGRTTELDIYCLEGTGNIANGDLDVNKIHLSDFLMIQGGTVVISASDHTPYDGVQNDASGYGNATIHGSIHVEGGSLDLYGTMDNPRIMSICTVDLKKETDAYRDHRGSTTRVKISYHENFRRPDNALDSTYTAFDLANGQIHTISTSLYVHEGYELFGWNIRPDAIPNETVDGWYEPGTVYEFYNLAESGYSVPTTLQPANLDESYKHYGDLTVYAIWKVNGYFIAFDPGVPDGENWSGNTETISCNYNEPTPIPSNGFIRPGYIFVSWKFGETTYYPGDNAHMLTTKNGETLTFTAQWQKCTHPENRISYELSGNVITKTCQDCHQSATAQLTAHDTVYDGSSHRPTLECSNEGFWKPTVIYSGTKIGSGNPVDNVNDCVNAGHYTATIQAGDITYTITFTISKADQPIPSSPPSYDPPAEGANTLTIHQIPQRTSPVSGAHAQYIVRYFDNNVMQEISVNGNSDSSTVTCDLPTGMTTYSVYVRYLGTDNYNPSGELQAQNAFFFEGSLNLTIVATEGISYTTSINSSGELVLSATMMDPSKYYLVGNTFNLVLSGSGKDQVIITDNQDNTYIIKSHPDATEDSATLTIGTARIIPRISVSVAEGQYFSSFANTISPAISRDSAFTALYEVSGYDPGLYQLPKLTFSSALPIGTTIILRDRTDNSYWYYCFDQSKSILLLNDFLQMGNPSVQYNPTAGTLKLQLIVDFSQVTSSALLQNETLTCTLSIDPVANKDAQLFPTAEVSVDLYSVGCSMLRIDAQSIQISVTKDVSASKYDHRDLAVVLTPNTELPDDASLLVAIGGKKTTIRPSNGVFIIPMGNFRTMTATIHLQLYSDLFPTRDATYTMSASLYLSASDADTAPICEKLRTIGESLSFTGVRRNTGVQILEGNQKRLFKVGEQITVTVNTIPEELYSGYSLSVQLHQKFQDGSYGNTVLKPTSNGNDYTFDLSSMADGSYCIVATVTDGNSYITSKATYYFILQNDN